MLVVKKLGGKDYYYSLLSYFLIDKSKSFSKYIGPKKPSLLGLESIEDKFRDELISKLSGKNYSVR